MGKCKTKAIQTDLGTFRHNQPYPGIIWAYSGIFRTLCNPGIDPCISRTLRYAVPEVCSKPWHIQNSGIFRTPVYSERWHIENPRLIHNPVHIYHESFCENS